MAGGFSSSNYKRFSGGLRYRFVDNRSANEDNSIIADGYFVTDVNINYKIENIILVIAIEILFNTGWNET